MFDWTIPKEWNIKDAYVSDERGNKIIDFKKNNLHVVGYSIAVDKTVALSELQEHVYSEEEFTSHPLYHLLLFKAVGFCISHKEQQKLKNGKYKVLLIRT